MIGKKFLKYKRYRFNPDYVPKYPQRKPEKQEHSGVKQEYIGNGEWRTIVCTCKVHTAYFSLIARLNPERYEKMVNPEPPRIRRRTELQKQFSNEKFERDNRGKTLARFKL
jgi:hypothetical protein